jgi:phosphoribosyl 1,2-cyclic phosphate phosphodiesterase
MNRIEEPELEKLKGLDVLVINALRREKHLSHFTLDEAVAVIEKVRPGRAYLTHISHQLGLAAEADPALAAKHIYYGSDGLKISTHGE